ncbi:hypothetical protein JHL21_02795 [Devosia sp. WQ 349]|uniref:hypothetical protein n=1 Tax=Devosia sp. WQ 349K1 TaxID=2800329 RepID=UPI0019089368|nr:hypothetical protein [Devosia sp. WQ 349K1]MBK1793423.1 hypothetical protein [Devosia sp. WQ 349K1]
MRLAPLALSIVVGMAAPAYADIAGKWSGEGEGDLSAEITHIEADRYGVSLSTVVPIGDTGGCAGGIDGEALFTAEGGNFFVENEDYNPSEPQSYYNIRMCEISFKLTPDGTLITEEVEGCGYYHGAACGFSGGLTRID